MNWDEDITNWKVTKVQPSEVGTNTKSERAIIRASGTKIDQWSLGVHSASTNAKPH